MTLSEAKEYVLYQEPTFLPFAKKIGNKQSYVCPCCQNGSKSSKTGITRVPGSSKHPVYHCFSCGANSDVFDLAREYFNCSTMKEAFDTVYSYYGLTIDGLSFSSNNINLQKMREEIDFYEVHSRITSFKEWQMFDADEGKR